MDIKQDLIQICQNFKLADRIPVIVKEPYIPYIPESSNKVLVVAESQNLSKKMQPYVDKLMKCSSNERILRLYNPNNILHIHPWDDGSIKLALASLNIEVNNTCVSNAVLWSQVGENEQNINPQKTLQIHSKKIWIQMLEVLKPEVIVCCGKIAQETFNNIYKCKMIHLRLPASTSLSRVSGMFSETDLLNRYPEVKRQVELNPKWVDGKYRLNKIFYACHAVSLYQH